MTFGSISGTRIKFLFEKQSERENIFQLLVPSPKDHNSQRLADPKPVMKNLGSP